MTQTGSAVGSTSRTVAGRTSLLTPSFALLCTAQLLGYGQYSLLTPIIPLFIRRQGGTATLVGLVTGTFSATSFFFRPLIGHAVDAWSARGVLGIGSLLLGVSGAAYLAYHPVLLFVVRGVDGLGWASFNTGAGVLLSRISSPERRGEALGYFSTAKYVAMAFAPAAALWLLGFVGFTGAFLIAALNGFLASAATAAISGQPAQCTPPTGEGLWKSLVEPSALLPSTLQFVTKVAQPAVSIFIPLYATYRGIAVGSLIYYFLALGITTIVGVGVCGRLSDRIGRGWTIAAGAGASGAALVLLSRATDILPLTVGGALAGFGLAAPEPSILALTIDRSRPERRGVAVATYSMAFQLAHGIGAVLSGVLIEAAGYPTMYLLATLAPAATFLLLARYWTVVSTAVPVPAPVSKRAA